MKPQNIIKHPNLPSQTPGVKSREDVKEKHFKTNIPYVNIYNNVFHIQECAFCSNIFEYLIIKFKIY